MHPLRATSQGAAPRLLVERGPQTPSPENVMATAYARLQGIERVETWTKALLKKRVTVMPDDVAIGSIDFVHQRLRMSGVTLPAPNDYPEAVRAHLHRAVTRMRLMDAQFILANRAQQLFIKPAETLKRFTGFVADAPSDYRFNGAGGRTPVWVCAPVCFISEWRVYAVAGRVLALGSAPGNPSKAVQAEERVITEIAERLYTMNGGYDGVCFDVGVLDDGRTALVEVNDGYSFGAYPGCTPEALWNVNAARQRQLIASVPIEQKRDQRKARYVSP